MDCLSLICRHIGTIKVSRSLICRRPICRPKRFSFKATKDNFGFNRKICHPSKKRLPSWDIVDWIQLDAFNGTTTVGITGDLHNILLEVYRTLTHTQMVLGMMSNNRRALGDSRCIVQLRSTKLQNFNGTPEWNSPESISMTFPPRTTLTTDG